MQILYEWCYNQNSGSDFYGLNLGQLDVNWEN